VTFSRRAWDVGKGALRLPPASRLVPSVLSPLPAGLASRLALPRTPPSRANLPPTAELRFPCPSPRDRISNKLVCGGARRCSAAQFNWVLPRRLPARRSPPSESATGADRIKPYTFVRSRGVESNGSQMRLVCRCVAGPGVVRGLARRRGTEHLS
jgi:hypothetical protein